MAKSTLDWKNDGRPVNTDELSPALAKLYGAYKDLSGKASEARKAFELSFITKAREAGMLTKDQTFAFGYKFGRMTVVATGTEAPKAKATTGIKL